MPVCSNGNLGLAFVHVIRAVARALIGGGGGVCIGYHMRRGDISFIARGTISYFVTSERSERGTKYDIVTRAIKLILPSLECDNLFITYLCLYLGQKSDYIFTLFIL